MLKRLYIDNFRCFVNFEFKPERKQLLLGANGTGKSSLLDAIRLLRSFLEVRGSSFEIQQESQRSKTQWQTRGGQVFELAAEIEGSTYLYRLENDVARLDIPAAVSSESLKVDGVPLLEVSKGEARIYPTPTASNAMTMNINRDASILPFLYASRRETRTFSEWLSQSIHCLKLVPGTIESFGRLDGQLHPSSDLSDVASWYIQIAGRDVKGVISLIETLKDVLDGFDSLEFKGRDDGSGDLVVQFNVVGNTIKLGINQLSDGQRCLVALHMILQFLIAKGHTVFLDEPDNFISLREIQPWLLSAEDAVDEHDGQLILISHHPEILNQWAKEFGLLFTREENGHVRTKPFSEVNDTGLEPAETIARGWEDE